MKKIKRMTCKPATLVLANLVAQYLCDKFAPVFVLHDKRIGSKVLAFQQGTGTNCSIGDGTIQRSLSHESVKADRGLEFRFLVIEVRSPSAEQKYKLEIGAFVRNPIGLGSSHFRYAYSVKAETAQNLLDNLDKTFKKWLVADQKKKKRVMADCAVLFELTEQTYRALMAMSK